MTDNDIAVTFHGKYHWGADQEFWRTPALSCSAKVVWILLRSAASMPNGVKISVLSRWAARYPGGIGRDIQELIAAGYVRRTMSLRHGAVIEKITYELYDSPQTLENQQSPRKSIYGFRGTESVKRIRVKSKVVKSKVVKSSSPPDPRDPEEEEIELPQPFNALTPAEARKIRARCHKLGVDYRLHGHEAAKKYKNEPVPRPCGLLLRLLDDPSWVEGLTKVQEREQASKAAKHAEQEKVRAEEEARERANREAQDLDAYFAGLAGEEQHQIRAEAAQLVPAVLRGSPVALRVEIRKVLQAQGGRP